MEHPVHVSRRSLLLLVLAGLVLLPAALLHAQEAQPSVSALTYDLSWWTVDGGGSTGLTTSQTYSLVGTIGQPDAGKLGSSRYGFVGGFWVPVEAEGSYDHQIYLPLVARNAP